MKRSIKLNFQNALILLCCFVSACDIHTTPEERLIASEKELLLAQTWRYDSIVIKGRTFILMNKYFEPPQTNEFLEAAADVRNRMIHYDIDRSYQLQWVSSAGVYWFKEPNWQPDFGFWKLNEDETILIHSPLQPYEHEYEILELSADRFIRRSDRFMELTTMDSLWLPGETLQFTEYFSKY